MTQFEAGTFFNTLSTFCQKLLRTMKEHLEVMIINNGMTECNKLLLTHFKFDYKRIDGYLYKDAFDFRMGDSYRGGQNCLGWQFAAIYYSTLLLPKIAVASI